MNLRALKILVVVMAVILIAGVIALIATIAVRLSRHEPVAAGSAPFAAGPIELPAGARIESMATGSDRAVLAILLSDGNRQLVIIDLASGRLLGTIPLRPAP